MIRTLLISLSLFCLLVFCVSGPEVDSREQNKENSYSDTSTYDTSEYGDAAVTPTEPTNQQQEADDVDSPSEETESHSKDSLSMSWLSSNEDSSERSSPAKTADKPSVDSEAQRLYLEGMKMLEEADSQMNVRRIAFQLLYEASERGHLQAREWVALGTLLGWGFYQSLPRAHAEFSQLALEGNPRGQFGLGLMYATGLLVNASVPHSLVYFTFSALGGDDLAEMAMAYRYWTGTGLEESCESALTYYYRVAKKVAKMVSERQQSSGVTMLGPLVRRARLLDEVDQNAGLLNLLFGLNGWTGDEAAMGGLTINEDLFQYYQFMADKKNVSAQVGLGQFYYHGRHGVEKNLEKAFYYFSMAAEAGSALAKAYLGEMYLIGSEAVKADHKRALKYLHESAEEDNPIGQTALAMVYLHGKAGVSVNLAKALEWLLKAADQGWADAQLILGRMFMGTGGVSANHKLALKYFTMASQQGNTLAFFYLGEMHATGVGVLRSCSMAAELFKNVAERGRWSKWFMYAHAAYRAQRYDEAIVTYLLLAELGYEVAQSNVAFMLEEGKVTVVDKSEFHARAFVQWQRSAAQGSTSSRVKLGDYYYYGWGTEVNYAKAAQQYRIASEVHHNSQAMFNLAYMHEQGLGLKRDIHLAKRYYDLAAESSLDAKIPVTLALLKLSVSFGSEYLREFGLVKFFSRMFGGTSEPHKTATESPKTIDPRITLDWDYYAIPILAGLLLALIVYLWHERRR
ncbi:putative extracellular protein sel-1 [Paragonimus heterotremus]|uniref:Putative extracellular protein sel-1 n=1 Tax=Paragonimus heterotremus TaxID=100268 RepID=A0A8J4WTE2_9TREM|nr:putative extracellular protein sel-1 [Paragonimus heterotremus]